MSEELAAGVTRHEEKVLTTDPRGGWITTFTGRRFYPLSPRAAEVCIEDIAHALSNLCRFVGHVSSFYSVAQHSVLVLDLLPHVTGWYRFWPLLHDGPEAYVGDMARPTKARAWFNLGPGLQSNFTGVERLLQYEIMVALNMPAMTPMLEAEIKRADLTAFAIECKRLMKVDPELEAVISPYLPTVLPLLDPLPPRQAEALFLERYRLINLGA